MTCILAVAGSGWEYPEHDSHWGDSCADQERGSPIDFRFLYELNKYRNGVRTTFCSHHWSKMTTLRLNSTKVKKQ